MRKLRTVTRALAGLTTTAVLVGGTLVAPSTGAAATKPHPRATLGATWLAKQLNQQLPFEQWGSPSWGPTLDAYFALDAIGVRATHRDLVLDTLESDVESYISYEGEDIAGAIAKTLSAVQADSRAESTYAGGDLLERLEAQIEPSGAEEGRVHEYSTYQGETTDWANTLDQAWAVQALAGADSQDEERALGFLLKQQCTTGWFREGLAATDACTATPSVDTTAVAVLAILEARRSGVDLDPAVVSASLKKAGAWLASAQRNNGSFAGVDSASSDSTGLAARALLALGRARPADDAAEWVLRNQVTAQMARRTALRKGDVGAIAPTRAALAEAKRKGIAADSRINWRLAAANAAPGLDALIPG